MRCTTCLLAATVLLVASTFSAHADTYEVIVSNFDGYGSSATFDLPSNPSLTAFNYFDGIHFAESTDVSFQFAPGAAVPFWVSGLIGTYTTPDVFQATSPMWVGFDGHGLTMAEVIGVEKKNNLSYYGFMFYAGSGEDLAFLDPNASVPTFELGTFGDVTIVNATPEPSTFVLLGTGILGLAGVARRKYLS